MPYEAPKVVVLGPVSQVVKGSGSIMLDADNKTPLI